MTQSVGFVGGGGLHFGESYWGPIGPISAPTNLPLRSVETAFSEYKLAEILGEGGAGKVYAATAEDNISVAIKILTTSTKDKRRRFKNEINFLERNKHQNIVSVLDHGTTLIDNVVHPFYVMPRYDCNFRDIINRVSPEETLDHFMQILEGIEAAHLQKVIHRDLFDRKRTILAIADFGIARFEEDFLITPVTTAPQQRLANFRYAAPEQRSGQNIGAPADVYALGLILNESFTGETPVGTDYRTISSVAETFGYLDEIVSAMIRQSPANRPTSIFEIKTLIKNANREIANRQKISKINSTVVPENTIDDILAIKPPVITDVTWDSGQLQITFDCNISDGWISGLHQMRESYGSVINAGPEQFHFAQNKARVRCSGAEAQRIINYVKDWLPKATRSYKNILDRQLLEKRQLETEKLRKEREIEQERFRVNSNLRI